MFGESRPLEINHNYRKSDPQSGSTPKYRPPGPVKRYRIPILGLSIVSHVTSLSVYQLTVQKRPEIAQCEWGAVSVSAMNEGPDLTWEQGAAANW